VPSIALHIRTDDIGVGATPLQLSIFSQEGQNATTFLGDYFSMKRPLDKGYSVIAEICDFYENTIRTLAE